MIVAIHQPNFLPWLGFFNKLAKSDVFVLFDDVQLPRGKSYCHRVAIKQENEARWLSVPVLGKSQLITIKEAQMVRDQPWRTKHLKTIESAYKRAPYFNNYFNEIKKFYLSNTCSLVSFNKSLIHIIKKQLAIPTKVICSSELNLGLIKGTEHILKIVQALDGDIYLTGQGEGSCRYLDIEQFNKAGIEVTYQNYMHPVYNQIGQGFIPNLSIIDLLFNEGPRAKKFL